MSGRTHSCRAGIVPARPGPAAGGTHCLRRLAVPGVFLVLLLTWFVLASDRAAAATSATEVIPTPPEDITAEDNLLILKLTLGGLTLSESIVGYQVPGSICLNLSELVRALDFPIEVDPQEQRAEGWFLSESRSFLLTADGATIAGEEATFDRERVSVYPEGLCIDVTLLSAWFPVELHYDQAHALVEVIPWETLPVQQRLERDRRRQLLGAQEEGGDNGYIRVAPDYRWWDWPVVDLTTGGQFARASRDERSELSTRRNVLATGDVLRLNGELFVAGDDDDPLDTVRVRLGRKDQHGNLLGPLGATAFTLGDIASPQSPLISRSVTGRGVEVTNYPLGATEEFDRTTLRGPLPIGWEVELYRNNSLLDYRLSREDGRFEFIDVPLQFGRNSFRLVFYGPQGQRREETEELFIDPGFVRPGVNNYRLAVNQQERDLLNFSNADDEVEEEEEDGEPRIVMQFERGLSETWSAGSSLYSLPIDSDQRKYLNGYLRTAFSSLTTRFEVAVDDRGGLAGELWAQGFFGPVNYLVRHDQFHDFRSERTESGSSDLTSLTTIRGDSVLPVADGFALPITLEANLKRHEDRRNELTLGHRISAARDRFFATNYLQADIGFGGDYEESERAWGSLLMNYRIGSVMIRSDLPYTLHPDPALDSFGVIGEWDIAPDMNASAGASHRMDDSVTTATAGLNQVFEGFALGSSLSADTGGGLFAGVSLTYSLGRHPWSGDLRVSPEHQAQSGGVAARAFIDRNRNGRFDGEDQPMSGVRFIADGHNHAASTNEAGEAFLPALPLYRDLGIAVQRGSVDDPYLTSSLAGYTVALRPGNYPQLDFPLVPTGEIDGLVMIARDGEETGLSSIELQLIDESGAVAMTTRSEFDGFYLFELVPLGRYRVRVAPDALDRLAAFAAPDHEVELSDAEPLAAGLDFHLLADPNRQPAAPGAAAQERPAQSQPSAEFSTGPPPAE